jgi:hypothetical protein
MKKQNIHASAVWVSLPLNFFCYVCSVGIVTNLNMQDEINSI